MSGAFRSLRSVAHRLTRTPTFTAVAIVTLAVGIGANTAIFSVVNGVLLKPLPYPEPDRLVTAGPTAPGLGYDQISFSDATYFYFKEQNRTLENLAAWTSTTRNLTGLDRPLRLDALAATHTIFPTLRVRPALGRSIGQDDDLPGAAAVGILTHEFWIETFGADPDILGRTIELDRTSTEIIGVMPEGFEIPTESVDILIPLRLDPAAPAELNHYLAGVGRLAPGVSVEEASRDLERVGNTLVEAFPDTYTPQMNEEARFGGAATSLRTEIVGDVSTALWVILGTVGFVLLIACANVANLFLVRAEGRQREIALRTALGADLGSLARYFLGESMGLAVMGGVLGTALAYIGLQVLLATAPDTIPRLGEVRIDPAVLLFTAGISAVAGLLFGAFPLIRYGHPNLVSALKEGGRGTTSGRPGHGTRNAMVVGQVALALMLLAGAGLMVRSFRALRSVDPGFDAENVLTLRIALPSADYSDRESISPFYEALLDRIRALPGVRAAGSVTGLPLAGDRTSDSVIMPEDDPTPEGELPPLANTQYAGPGYFEAMGIRVLEGRVFEPRDAYESPGGVVITQALARKFWPEESAVGKRVAQFFGEPWYQVIGVIEDVRERSLVDDDRELVYWPVRPLADEEGQLPWSAPGRALVVRTDVDPLSLLPAIRREIWAMDPNLPIADVRTMARILDRSMARTSFTTLLLAIAASVALILGTVGIYGVISYAVSQRTQEIGVRLALGAERRGVEAMVLRQGATLAGLGIAVGVVGALALTRVMASLLVETSATDPVTLVSVAVLLAAVASVASWLPARRAASTDPMIAMRAE